MGTHPPPREAPSTRAMQPARAGTGHASSSSASMTTEGPKLSTRPVNPPSRQHRRPWFAVAVVALLALTGFGYWRGTESVERQVNGGLVVDPKALNFGEVWVDSAFEWTLPIQNSTDQSIDVAGLSASCGCTSVEPRSFALGPSETTDLTLTLDLTAYSGDEADAAIRGFSVRIVPRIKEDPGRYPGWAVRGRVRNAFRIEKRRLHAGHAIVRGTQPSAQSVRFWSYLGLKDVRAECDPEFASLALIPTDRGNTAFRLEIRPKRALAVGPFSRSITLTGVAESGDVVTDKSITVSGTVVEPVEAIPDRIVFGAQPLGVALESHFALLSRRGEGFVARPTQDGASTLTVIPLDAEGHGFRVLHVVDTAGEFSKVISLAVSTEDGEDFTLDLPIVGFGVEEAAQTFAIDDQGN